MQCHVIVLDTTGKTYAFHKKEKILQAKNKPKEEKEEEIKKEHVVPSRWM